ncbi:MAG: DUF3301 domain-containing protein [Halothiobacillaceae bacterium]
MMSFGSLLTLVLIVLALWAWWRHDRARAQALRIAREACVSAGVQLLDDSVGLRKLKPRRGMDGRWVLEREFAFEFSRSGADRWAGSVRLLGTRLLGVELDLARPLG